MKFCFFLLVFFSFSLQAKLPSSLPNFDNINSILFKDIKDYMFQVLVKTRLYEFDNNCRLYKYQNIRVMNSDRDMLFCLETIVEEEKITQVLRVKIDNQKAGNIKLIHEGEKRKAISFDQFINFQIGPPAKGAKTSFFFDHSTFGLIIDRRRNEEILKAFMQLDDFKIEITEDGLINNRYRNYLLTCGSCEGISWLKVQEDDSQLRYFSGSSATEVTPSHFGELMGFFIIRPFSQLGSQFKDALVFELNWPGLD